MAIETQDPDSLRRQILILDEDTNMINALYALAWVERTNNSSVALVNAQNALKLAEKLGDKVKIGMCLNMQGLILKYEGEFDLAIASFKDAIKTTTATKEYKTLSYAYSNLAGVYSQISRYDLAIDYNTKSMELKKTLNDTSGISICLGNIGIVYYHQSDFPNALDYFIRALKLRDIKTDPIAYSRMTMNIGIIYAQNGESDKAMEYYYQCLEINNKQNDDRGIAGVYIAMGATKIETKEYKTALLYYDTALVISKRLGYKEGLSYCYNNMGEAYALLQDYSNARANFEKNIEIREELGGDKPIAIAYMNMGRVNYDFQEYAEAIVNVRYALTLSLKANYLSGIKTCYSTLSDVYEALGKHEEALEYFKLKVEINDSIFNEDKSKEIGKLEATYEFEKNEEERNRRELAESNEIRKAESRRNNLQYSGILIFIVLIFSSVFMLGRFAVPVRLAEGMIFFSFLLFFEFALVLLDPYIETFSGGAPALKLGFNAVLAAAIFPLHSLFESRVKRRLSR